MMANGTDVSINVKNGNVKIFGKSISAFVDKCIKLQKVLTRTGHDDKNALKKQLNAIDTEIDHVHGVDIGIDFIVDIDGDYFSLVLNDMLSLWKTKDGNVIKFYYQYDSSGGNISTNAMTPLEYVPHDVISRIEKTLKETFIKCNAITDKIDDQCDKILYKCAALEFHPNLVDRIETEEKLTD